MPRPHAMRCCQICNGSPIERSPREFERPPVIRLRANQTTQNSNSGDSTRFICVGGLLPDVEHPKFGERINPRLELRPITQLNGSRNLQRRSVDRKRGKRRLPHHLGAWITDQRALSRVSSSYGSRTRAITPRRDECMNRNFDILANGFIEVDAIPIDQKIRQTRCRRDPSAKAQQQATTSGELLTK